MTAVPFPTMRSEQLAATARFILRFYFFKNAAEPVATRNPACRYTRQDLLLHAAALGCYTLNTFHTL